LSAEQFINLLKSSAGVRGLCADADPLLQAIPRLAARY
jgi:hypothetical protein